MLLVNLTCFFTRFKQLSKIKEAAGSEVEAKAGAKEWAGIWEITGEEASKGEAPGSGAGGVALDGKGKGEEAGAGAGAGAVESAEAGVGAGHRSTLYAPSLSSVTKTGARNILTQENISTFRGKLILFSHW